MDQYDGIRLGEDGDFARRCAVPEPILSETQSRSHLGLSLQLSNINSIEVLANVVFGISAAERHISTPWAPSVLANVAQALTPSRMKCNPGRSSCNPRQLKGTQPPPPFAAGAACRWELQIESLLPGLRRPGRLGLGYASQREIPKTRNAPRADDQMRLGGSNDPLEPFPQKPRGMHWRTYRRLRDQANAATAEADDLLAESMLGQFLDLVAPRRKRQRGRRDGAPKPPPAAALHQLHLGRTGPIGPERRQ